MRQILSAAPQGERWAPPEGVVKLRDGYFVTTPVGGKVVVYDQTHHPYARFKLQDKGWVLDGRTSFGVHTYVTPEQLEFFLQQLNAAFPKEKKLTGTEVFASGTIKVTRSSEENKFLSLGVNGKKIGRLVYVKEVGWVEELDSERHSDAFFRDLENCVQFANGEYPDGKIKV